MSQEARDRHTGDILVVDDTLANLRLLMNMLTERGYKVRGVPNGSLALNVTRLAPPELILLDINMPELDGYEVCRQLKDDAHTHHIPVIFISALDETLDKVKAFTVGGVDYITKPIQFEEVLARVETHLSLRRLQQELQRANEELEQRVAERTEELTRQMELFRKFVPQTFTETIGQKGFDVRDGLAREETYTVLCCDIRDFTALSDAVTCVECYQFLNSFFAVVEPGIRNFGGFVYQYVGDEIVALFKLSGDRYADQAVQAAVAIQNQILVGYNRQRQESRYPPIRVGIGINTGPVAIGIAGTPERMDACAFGSTVNLAARCQALTKEFETRTIITEETYRHLRNPDAFTIQSLGRSSIRGMKEQVHLFAVLDAAPVHERE
jgi:class 3 adenylate cyclase